MKPRVFKWRDAWYVTWCAGYDNEFMRERPFATWREALDYVFRNVGSLGG